MGYKNIYHFGSVFFDLRLKLPYGIIDLESKIEDYLNEIPEDVVYSVLPVIRWQNSLGNYRTLSLAKSVKITRDTSR